MAARDLSTEFHNLADLVDLASTLMNDNMQRISIPENVGYTLPHAEACRLASVLIAASEFAGRVRREMDDEFREGQERRERERSEGGAS